MFGLGSKRKYSFNSLPEPLTMTPPSLTPVQGWLVDGVYYATESLARKARRDRLLTDLLTRYLNPPSNYYYPSSGYSREVAKVDIIRDLVKMWDEIHPELKEIEHL